MSDATPIEVTYQWADEEQTSLKRLNADGSISYISADPANSDYAAFMASEATAASYVAPPAPPESTTAEKVDNMLAAYGLTRAEMQAALAVKGG